MFPLNVAMDHRLVDGHGRQRDVEVRLENSGRIRPAANANIARGRDHGPQFIVLIAVLVRRLKGEIDPDFARAGGLQVRDKTGIGSARPRPCPVLTRTERAERLVVNRNDGQRRIQRPGLPGHLCQPVEDEPLGPLQKRRVLQREKACRATKRQEEVDSPRPHPFGHALHAGYMALKYSHWQKLKSSLLSVRF